MKDSLQSQIIELKSKITILEEENFFLSAKAEENLLLNRAFEEISNYEEIDTLFKNTLESISILLDIAFAGIFDFSSNQFKYYSSYILSQNNEAESIKLSISDKYLKDINSNKPIYINTPDVELLIEDEKNNSQFTCYLIIPLKSDINKKRYFVFANDANSPDLKDRIPLLEKVINIISSRLERIFFQNEMIRVNKELQEKNKKLQEKNQIIDNQNSSLKSTMKHLQQTQANLVQSEIMASLGILTAGVAHEINNPLNFIVGGVNGLRNYIKENVNDENTRLHELTKFINTGVERISNIVISLNQFSRDINTYNEVCNIESIIDNCLVMLNNQIKHRIDIVKEYRVQSPLILGNIGKLHQVFINILSNSIQSIEKMGTITIIIKKLDSNIIVEIKDTGYGISKENIEKITDPFFTTKEPGKGTGLGLSISYNIIKKHKGNIRFTSEQGVGTSAILNLPAKN